MGLRESARLLRATASLQLTQIKLYGSDEKRTVDAIRRNLASGTYKATEYVDDDVVTGNSFALSVTALISDGQLKLDFSGSADQSAERQKCAADPYVSHGLLLRKIDY